MPFLRGSFWPGDRTWSLAFQEYSLPSEPPEKPVQQHTQAQMSVSIQWFERKHLIAWLEEMIKLCFKAVYTPSESTFPEKQQGSCSGHLPLSPEIQLASFFTLSAPEPWSVRTISVGLFASWILDFHWWKVQTRKWRNRGEMWIAISLASSFVLQQWSASSPKVRRSSTTVLSVLSF